MGCKMGRSAYRALPVEDPSKSRVQPAAAPAPSAAPSVREVLPKGAAPPQDSSSASTAPAPALGLLDGLGLGSGAAAAEALSDVVGGFLPAASDRQAVLHDAGDDNRGIFSDFAQGSPQERVKAGVGEKASASIGGAAPAMARSPDKVRLAQYIASLKDLPNDSSFTQGVGCFMRWCVKPLLLVSMAYIWVGKKLYDVFQLLPTNMVQIIFGLGLCLFGGVYFTAIAAVEAAINMGGADMYEHLRVCWREGSVIAEANQRDDELDEDHDGTADVLQLPYHELAQRKAVVAMKAVREPDRLQQAVFALANVYVAVLATLKFQFAKTVAVALGIANMLTLPVTQLIGPCMATAMGKELNHWVPVIIDTSVKIVAVVVASWVQAFISAFYSALRGGRLCAEGLLNICSERGWMDMLPDSLAAKPFNPDESFLDECLAYPLAAGGFYLQVSSGFTVMFPFNIALLPLTLVEYILRYQVYT